MLRQELKKCKFRFYYLNTIFTCFILVKKNGGLEQNLIRPKSNPNRPYTLHTRELSGFCCHAPEEECDTR